MPLFQSGQRDGRTRLHPVVWFSLQTFPFSECLIKQDVAYVLLQRQLICGRALQWPPPLTSNSMELEVQGKKIQLSEQLQLHAPNNMLDHPLVSLVNQGSLGGLPPLCIVHGNAELLRDEQIYAAHKAAHPAKYPPAQDILDRYPSQRRSG